MSERSERFTIGKQALIEASDCLDCAMVMRDDCEARRQTKDQRRRNGDEQALDLDG